MTAASGRVAVFDLDGTITRRDTLVAYLAGFLRAHPGRAWRLWRLPFSLLRYALGLSDRGRLKSNLIRQVLGGLRRAEVDAWTTRFCASTLPSLLNPGALAAIERHRDAGDRLVLLSASVDLYVPAIGRRLGFEETVCTGVAWSGETLDGALTTPNRRGAEKAHCIERLRARYPAHRFAAYGNASSDFAHLRLVEEPLLVNAGRSARRQAAELGIRCGDWRD